MSDTSSTSMTGSYDAASMLTQAQSQASSSQASSTASKLHNMKNKTPEQIDQAAQDFEAMFLTEMLKPMFDTVKTDPMFGGGHGEDMWKSIMVSEYSKEIAKNGGVGIADAVKDVMLKAQESDS